MENYDKTIRDDLVQLGLRIGRSDRDWFAGYCKELGQKQHDLIVDYIKKLRNLMNTAPVNFGKSEGGELRLAIKSS